MLIKGFKYRIYPTKDQITKLNQHFGASRFVYNYFLNRRKESYLNNVKLNYNGTSKELTSLKKDSQYAWMKELNSQALQASLRDLDVAYNKFFTKKSKFPTFHKKHGKQSFRAPQHVILEKDKIYVHKFSEGININLHRQLQGKICYATFSKTKTNKFYVSITCKDVPSPVVKKSNTSLGLDLGIKSLITTSDGTKFINKNLYRKSEPKLKYLGRQLSKKLKGGSNRNKARNKIAKLHEKISNQKQDYLHKISSKIVSENQAIFLEDLGVANMLKNRSLAKSIQDCSWQTFTNMLAYKAEWNNRTLVKIDRFFPSSKLCSSCGYINETLTLGNREWSCPKCNSLLDRDINAALNIKKQGLNILSGLGTKSDIKQKPGKALVKVFSHEKRLAKSTTQEAHEL